MVETHPIGNFIPKNIQYLLLGSFAAKGMADDPQYDWYYGSKRNQFWRIIEQVYGVTLDTKATKVKLFTDLQIGISDIIYQCERKVGSSLDANLINIVYNPKLREIVKENKIKGIFFTSRFVENNYRKHFKDLVIECPEIKLVTLPSPSPRYASMTKEQKIERYIELLPKVGK